ncbi:MAG: hypothetical protein NTY35_12875 [Planctomycetota bacterium]|nr:hypothetical protein [Planctomycetota bacterium]
MTAETDPIDDFFRQIALHVEADPAWRAELRESRREFFPGGRPHEESDAAHRRHLEWFLLERTDTHGPELALERALRAWMPEFEAGLDDWMAGLRQTHVGVLEVTGIQSGEGLWLRDLGGRGEFPVAEQAASRFVEVGDIIAGRLFPIGGGVHRLSSASAFHRDPRVLEALRADFESARTERRGVLRVGQREVESMFFRGSEADEIDAVADARRLLVDSGVDADAVEVFFEDLAQAPFDEDRLVHGAQDVLSEILDDLAFESAVDIDAARRALLAAWAQLARRGPGEGPSLAPNGPADSTANPHTDVARAVARFEERRRAGEPVAQLLDELERDLALGDGPSSETDGDPIPDFPGVVGAMVEEFLWETAAHESQAAAERHANLRDLGRSAENVGVFENLRGRDLLVYAGWWLPENDTLGGADDARARMASLAVFCRWAEAEHEVALHTEFHETLTRLGTTLPRIAEANQRRTRGARRDEGELYEVLALDGERGQVRGRSGNDRSATIELDLATWLRPGDRLRGTLREDGRLAVYCCYPPEVAELAESAAE